MEVGFIGLGNLGTVMVENLIERGRKLHLYNRSKDKMLGFKDRVIVHESVIGLAKQCDIVVSIVSDDNAVNAITLGHEGLVENMKAGSVHVCLSTISPATCEALEKAHNQKNIDYLTATVIGRPEAAKARNTTVCISGKSSSKEAVIEILKDLGGNKIYEFGANAKSAAVIKICNNFLILSAIEAMGEAMNLAGKAGADVNGFYNLITETIFNAPIYKNYGKIIIDESYHIAGFTSQLGLKDTKLALSLAEELSTPLPLGDLIKNRYLINHNRGRNNWDWTSIVKVIKEESESMHDQGGSTPDVPTASIH
jgi:3-hydroxyisobutyrate dehydrogenase-like beta-hydroxyacid dehydrogenase